MRVPVLLLSCITAHAAIVNVYSGLPQNAGNFSASSLNFAGDTSVGSFFAPDIDFGTGTQNWDPLGMSSNYGADITATIQVRSAGTYTFNTTSDDGSLLFIDGQLVVNNNYYQGATQRTGSINLSAGTHTMEVQYFQGGGGNSLVSTLPAGVAYVYEQPTLAIYSDSGSLTPVGSEVPPPLIPPGATLVGGIPITNINFGLPNSNWSPFGLASNFSAEMQGYFNIPSSGAYTFSTGSDDGSYLFIDGQMVVNNGFYQGYTVRQGTVTLSAGSHFFDLQYFQGEGGAALTIGVPAGVTISAVPETATWIQLATALGGAWALWIRRRTQAAAQFPALQAKSGDCRSYASLIQTTDVSGCGPRTNGSGAAVGSPPRFMRA